MDCIRCMAKEQLEMCERCNGSGEEPYIITQAEYVWMLETHFPEQLKKINEKLARAITLTI